MGNLPDISNLLEAEKHLFDTQQRLRIEVKKLEEGKKKLREHIVQLYKAAKVSYEECDHPIVEYDGMGMHYCSCCDTSLLDRE